jgi:hypothetical protein
LTTKSNSNFSAVTLLVAGGGISNQSLIMSSCILQSVYPTAIIASIAQQTKPSKVVKSTTTSTTTTNNQRKKTTRQSFSYGSSAITNNNINTHNIHDNMHDDERIMSNTKVDTSNNYYSLQRQKPYFAIAPPSDDIIQHHLSINNILINKSICNTSPTTITVQPPEQFVSVVGRVGSVRRISQKLVFFDLLPPDTTIVNEQYPWRCPESGIDMAVQVIGGKTLCEFVDNEEQAISAIKSISTGQLLLIEGRSNIVGSFLTTINNDSINNWLTKRSFDIVLYTYQLLSSQQQQFVVSDNSSTSISNTRTSFLGGLQNNNLYSKTSNSFRYNGYVNNNNKMNNQINNYPLRSVTETEPSTRFDVYGDTFWRRPITEATETTISSNIAFSNNYYFDQNNNRYKSNAISKKITNIRSSSSSSGTSSSTRTNRQKNSSSNPLPSDPAMFLSINDVYTNTIDNNNSTVVVVVNDIVTAQLFDYHVKQLLSMTNLSPIQRLIGLDCEWKPNFLFDNEEHDNLSMNNTDTDRQRQPVLVLQISLHSLEKVYVLDLQMLLRPYLYHVESISIVTIIITITEILIFL